MALNKAGFLEKLQEETGEDDVEIFENHASFDDAFRHSLIIDISDMKKLKLVERPDILNVSNDYILKWTEVQQLPKKLGPNQVLMHAEMGGESMWFPIPTV